MEYMYTQVKIHLKSGILASTWYCKMQGSQKFQGFCPLDAGLCPGPTGGMTTYPSESHEYCFLDINGHEKVMNSDKINIVATLL